MKNKEGYADPVAFMAIRNVEKEERAAKASAARRPLVYICSPYAGDTGRNTVKAREFCRFAVMKGAIPVAPHLMFPQFMSETHERELALSMGIVLLGKCEELWVFGNHVSAGMAAEIAKAKRQHKKIRYFTEGLKEERG